MFLVLFWDQWNLSIFAMFANKLIKKGQEITTSYSDPTPDNEAEVGPVQSPDQYDGSHKGHMMPCQCGARNCKGLMF